MARLRTVGHRPDIDGLRSNRRDEVPTRRVGRPQPATSKERAVGSSAANEPLLPVRTYLPAIRLSRQSADVVVVLPAAAQPFQRNQPGPRHRSDGAVVPCQALAGLPHAIQGRRNVQQIDHQNVLRVGLRLHEPRDGHRPPGKAHFRRRKAIAKLSEDLLGGRYLIRHDQHVDVDGGTWDAVDRQSDPAAQRVVYAREIKSIGNATKFGEQVGHGAAPSRRHLDHAICTPPAQRDIVGIGLAAK